MSTTTTMIDAARGRRALASGEREDETMAKTDPAARPRRTPPARPGHRDANGLLTLGAGVAILAGWLVLARDAPATGAGAASIAGGGAAPVGTTAAQVAPVRSGVQARPRPITRTRSSR
ncbi:MAG: hypothetical protein U0232_03215 [Thermomicrobiales bacterium]